MDDELKQRVTISALAFSAVAMLYALYCSMTRDEAWTGGAFFWMVVIAVVLGGVAGGAAFVISAMLKK